jgi:hypothetical protein
MLLTRGTTGQWVSAVALSGILATPVAATAQAVVRAVIVGENSVPVTDGVHLSRFADLTEEPRIAVDAALEVGDLFWATRSDVLLEIECPAKGRTPFRFSGPFRVVVLPPRPAIPCVLQLLAGGVDVRADEEATEINAGGIVMGSKGTQYAVRLRRDSEGPVCDTVVYDDYLNVTPMGLETVQLPSNNGWTYNFATRRGSRGAISEQMVTQSASIATKFDLTRWRPVPTAPDSVEAQRKAAERELYALHVEVLTTPANQSSRAKLGNTQERFGITDGARYNLKRAGAFRADVRNLPETDSRRPAPQALPSGAATTRRPPEAAATPNVTAVVEPATRALELVHAGNPAQAIELLRPRMEASKATTRELYALAEAYVATRNPVAARKAAEQALGSRDAARVLSASEIERLRTILRGRE